MNKHWLTRIIVKREIERGKWYSSSIKNKALDKVMKMQLYNIAFPGFHLSRSVEANTQDIPIKKESGVWIIVN